MEKRLVTETIKKKWKTYESMDKREILVPNSEAEESVDHEK